MDTFLINNLKAEKANRPGKNWRLKKMVNLFRMIELCIVLILISRLSTQLPVAVKKSGDYFRDLKVILISPRFVFVLGNAILIALFAKSGQFSSQESNTKDDLYDRFVEKSKRNENVPRVEKVFHDKHAFPGEGNSVYKDDVHRAEKIKRAYYNRSRSENSRDHEHARKPNRVILRRSITEKCERNAACSGGELAKGVSFPEDAMTMSNEEFRRTVEDFIARQQKFRRDEEEEEEEEYAINVVSYDLEFRT